MRVSNFVVNFGARILKFSRVMVTRMKHDVMTLPMELDIYIKYEIHAGIRLNMVAQSWIFTVPGSPAVLLAIGSWGACPTTSFKFQQDVDEAGSTCEYWTGDHHHGLHMIGNA